MVGYYYYLKLQWYLMSEEKRKLHEISQLQFLLVIQSNSNCGNEGLHLLNSNIVHVNKQKFMMTPSKTFLIWPIFYPSCLDCSGYMSVCLKLILFFIFFLGDSFLATLLDPCKQLAFFFNCVLEDGHYFLIGMQSYTKVVTY